jgi:hypothetical protein
LDFNAESSIFTTPIGNNNDLIENDSASGENEDTEIQIEDEGNTNAEQTESTSSVSKYCKCTKPQMTDLAYETESQCQYTLHHLQKGKSLYGRKCFDCKGLLSDKIKGKHDLLHWCKNSILTDDDGDFLCDFVICPSCHDMRMKDLDEARGSSNNRRRSRRSH